MARTLIISREAREAIKQQLHNQGEWTKSELIELIRPHCSFDPVNLQEQALNRIAGSIVRSMRDEDGTRTAFLIQGRDTIVDIETCGSYPKVAAVEEQLTRQLDGLTRSRHKALRRKLQLSGQTSLLEAAQ